MFAIAAAVIFGFALLLDLFDENLGAPDAFNPTTLMMAGLLCIALHFAGFGTAVRGRWRGRSYRGRRPGPG
jgi:hypothetical protein